MYSYIVTSYLKKVTLVTLQLLYSQHWCLHRSSIIRLKTHITDNHPDWELNTGFPPGSQASSPLDHRAM